AARLRRWRYDAGILLTPSFSSALLFLLAGVQGRRGTATDGREFLLDDPVDLKRGPGVHRSSVYHWLVTGEIPSVPPVPRLALPRRARERWQELVPPGGGPRV